MSELGDFIRKIRLHKKMSLRDAAEKIGISHSYLSVIENGLDPRSKAPVKPTPETLGYISKAYNVEYNKLMELAGYISSKNNDDNSDNNETNDVEIEITKILDDLEKRDYLMFDGEPIDAEDWQKVKNAILFGLEFAKKNKK